MIFLAQEHFEAYEKIAGSDKMLGRLINPFFPELLQDPEHFYSPFAGSVGIHVVWTLTMGTLLLWAYFRLNKVSILRDLGASCLGLGIALLAFWRSAFPHPFGFLLAGVSILGLMTSLTAALSIVAAQNMSYFGVDEKYLTDPKDGSIRPAVPYVTGVLLVLGAVLLLPMPVLFLKAVVHFNAGLFWLIVLGALLVVPVVGRWQIPFEEVEGATVLGGGKVQELPKLFKVTGPATRPEVVVVGLGTFLLYAAIFFVFKNFEQLTGGDVVGFFLMSLLAFNMIRAELARNRDVDVPERARGTWG